MENYKDKYVSSCPYCGGKEIIEAAHSGYGLTSKDNKWGCVGIYYSICRNCGSVLRSFVKKPEMLLKKEDRKKL